MKSIKKENAHVKSKVGRHASGKETQRGNDSMPLRLVLDRWSIVANIQAPKLYIEVITLEMRENKGQTMSRRTPSAVEPAAS